MPLRALAKPEPPLKRWLRIILPYLFSLASSAVALALTLQIPAIAEKPFHVLFLAATIACAWLYGLASALVSVGLNLLALFCCVIPHSRGLLPDDTDDVIRAIVFGVISLLVAWAIGRLRSTQEAFRISQERLQLAQEVAKMWAWELDLQSSTVLWSSIPDRGTHSRSDSVATWMHRIHPDDRERVTRVLTASALGRRPYEMEFRVVQTNGESRWLASRGEFYTARAGEQRMMGVNLDITLRKQAERALEAAARGQMAGELAHEINNPLQALTHALYLLHSKVMDTQVQEYSELANTAADRVSQLVKELLRLYPPAAA